MKFSNLAIMSLLAAATLVGCAPGQQASQPSDGLPAVGSVGPQGLVKAKAVFSISSNSGAAQAYNMTKKVMDLASLFFGLDSKADPSNLAFPTCSHAASAMNPCTDYVDITVDNLANTQFAIDHALVAAQLAGQAGGQPTTAGNLVNFVSLHVGTLFDNNLNVCGSGNQLCTQAKIVMYTDNSNVSAWSGQSSLVQAGGSQGPNGMQNQALPLNVQLTTTTDNSGAASPAIVPDQDDPSTGIVIESAQIGSLQVIDQSILPLGGEAAGSLDAEAAGGATHGGPGVGQLGYQLSADFSNAAAGVYESRVVLEYVVQ
jgi:hypothetical protein